MAIPHYQSIRLSLLELAGDGETHRICQAILILAQRLELTDDETRELVRSGKRPKFHDRVYWARTYLTWAGLLESPKRGYFRITDRGRSVLGGKPSEISREFLEQFEEFRHHSQRPRRTHAPKVDAIPLGEEIPEETPEESLQAAYLALQRNLADELLQAVMESPPEFFERLVVDLLVRMGYGGSREEAGEAIGRSGDEGIDGIIKEDRLGLDIIYVQAKRWKSVVGRPEVQKFAGALQGQRARKGVFITTSTFSRNAEEYAEKIETKVILIGGTKLAELMIDHGVGVTTEATYELKRIDSDYFPDD